MTEQDKTPAFHDIFKRDSLRVLKEQLITHPYPGYPAQSNRLFAEGDSIQPVALPLGPWELSDGAVPSISEQDSFRTIGLETDAYGRPLHPWFWDMYEDPSIGVLTGKGFYWNWGPNYTADAVVLRTSEAGQREILLIQRSDTGAWALPGGFIETTCSEDPETAARREAAEETGVTIPDDCPGWLVYQGPLADPRATANAWPNTSAYLFDVTGQELARPRGNDDAVDARWFTLETRELPLHGSHGLIIQQALASTALLVLDLRA